MRLLATADSLPPIQSEIFRLALACRPDAVVFAGDAAYANSSDSLRRRMLRRWKRDWGPLWPLVRAVPGNHDLDSPDALAVWRDAMGPRSPTLPAAAGLGFRLRVGPVLALGIDTTSGTVDSLQREWIADELARATAAHRIAVYHEPAFPQGLHRGRSLDAVPRQRDRLWSVLETGGVQVVLNGHEHAYARSAIRREGTVQQIITGGAGAALYTRDCPGYDVFRPEFHVTVLDADENHMHIRALNLSGEIIDELDVAPGSSAVGP